MSTETEKIYETLWRNKWLTAEATTIQEMVELLRSATDLLERMAESGVTLDPDGGTGDDYARLITTDVWVAKQFGLEECDLYDYDEDNTGEEELN